MMYDGKLRWSHQRGGWWTAGAHDDEHRYYVAERSEGGWTLTSKRRWQSDATGLGWYIYLKDAKLAADRHHHAMIRESDNENLKKYIERYPV
jgi:hypothetical protein